MRYFMFLNLTLYKEFLISHLNFRISCPPLARRTIERVVFMYIATSSSSPRILYVYRIKIHFPCSPNQQQGERHFADIREAR